MLVYGTARLCGGGVHSLVGDSGTCGSCGADGGSADGRPGSVGRCVAATEHVAEEVTGLFDEVLVEATSFAGGSGTDGRSGSTDGRSADGRSGSVGRVRRLLIIHGVRNLLGVAVGVLVNVKSAVAVGVLVKVKNAVAVGVLEIKIAVAIVVRVLIVLNAVAVGVLEKLTNAVAIIVLRVARDLAILGLGPVLVLLGALVEPSEVALELFEGLGALLLVAVLEGVLQVLHRALGVLVGVLVVGVVLAGHVGVVLGPVEHPVVVEVEAAGDARAVVTARGGVSVLFGRLRTRKILRVHRHLPGGKTVGVTRRTFNVLFADARAVVT